ncbi:MAG: flagellar basal body L-ring protein FlgH [Armatimonadetes bacterium]|nr:flagellar basal body L-ring protein FlgH [Armatimonadota bacterium]NOG92598.1 flagellar basal body L-ring protein FlgH [Armatimonadota bacterium]
MKTALTALALLASAFAIGQSENPGSLWSDSAKNPLIDRKARSVDDVLTVLISEQSTASSSGSTATAKQDDNQITAGLGPILESLIPALGTSASHSGSGSGTTTRTGKFTTRMTVIVKEVLENGNFVIEGSRFIQINKDVQKFVITGIVRPDDIRSDNTILSEFVAEAEIRYDGKGTVSDRQRKGILTTLLDWLF